MDLYHEPVSICCIMARYTYALRGDPENRNAEMHIKEGAREVKAGHVLTEHFLCDIDANGEVPVLAPAGPHGKNRKPLPDSVDITSFIASRYSSLLPKEHKEKVKG